MRVLAIRDTCEGAPEELRKSGFTESNKGISRVITKGKEYEVHAIVVWSANEIRFCFVSDPFPYHGRPGRVGISWLPSWFFQVIDPTVPDDWECHTFERLPLIIGPAFISESHDAYIRMVDLVRDQTDKFWERLKRLNEKAE